MPSCIRPARRCQEAFTLMELLVVMAVIAILAGILLPVIHQARIQAKIAATGSLISQTCGALTRYSEDWGSFPPDWVDGTAYVRFDDYEEANPTFSGTMEATASALYYYLVNPNITRKHPYLELQADIQFKNQNYSTDYSTSKLRVAVDPWERPLLYNRRQFSSTSPGYYNFRGPKDGNGFDVLRSAEFDLYSVGPNGKTSKREAAPPFDLPSPKDDLTGFNQGALHSDGYGYDSDDVANWH